MCNNGRAPKDGPSVNWLVCLLQGYLRGYLFGGSRPSWVYRRNSKSDITDADAITFQVGGKTFRVTVREV